LAALNSTTKPRCRGCTAGYYCPGDGTEKRCGESSPTEYSEGAAANCSACPEGWVGEMFLCYGRGGCRLGIGSLTEYSFEAAMKSSACPEGWVGEVCLCYGRGGCHLGITALVATLRSDVEKVRPRNTRG